MSDLWQVVGDGLGGAVIGAVVAAGVAYLQGRTTRKQLLEGARAERERQALEADAVKTERVLEELSVFAANLAQRYEDSQLAHEGLVVDQCDATRIEDLYMETQTFINRVCTVYSYLLPENVSDYFGEIYTTYFYCTRQGVASLAADWATEDQCGVCTYCQEAWEHISSLASMCSRETAKIRPLARMSLDPVHIGLINTRSDNRG